MSSGHNARCDQRFSDMDHLDRHRDQGRHGGCFTDRVVSLSTGTCVTGGTPSGAAGHAAGDISACDSASSRDLGRCGKSASTGTARASTRTTACDFGGLGHLRGPDLGPVGPDGAQRCSRCCSKDAAEGCAGEAHRTTEEQHNGIVCDAHWSAAAAADGTASNVQLVNGQLRRDFIFSERGKLLYPAGPGNPHCRGSSTLGTGASGPSCSPKAQGCRGRCRFRQHHLQRRHQQCHCRHRPCRHRRRKPRRQRRDQWWSQASV